MDIGAVASETQPNNCILDTGASSTFVRPDTKLLNPRRVHRAVQGAGQSALSGRLMGQYGPLHDAIAVEELQHNLVSIGSCCDEHDLDFVFTSKGCYALPHGLLNDLLQQYIVNFPRRQAFSHHLNG